LFVRLETYSATSYQFSVTDAELITSDNQRLGVTVSGSVFRPNFTKSGQIADLWTRYRTIYISDEALQAVVNDLSAQAMKVCVGDRPFRESIIGSARDDMRMCIDSELSSLMEPYGLDVQNVTVPNVILSPEVQALLDSITKSRLETEKAVQDKLRATAEGEAKQAEQEATIRVEQSRIQEEARQKTLLAELSRQQLAAEKSVIEAQKSNDLLSAQKDLEISRAQAAAAAEKAKADLAQQFALAQLYRDNPNYYQLQIALANASAIKDTDKMIFVPEGTFPQLVFGNNLTPVVPVTPPVTP
jgi:murein L,D-transpeptidase YcbB/YkuD